VWARIPTWKGAINFCGAWDIFGPTIKFREYCRPKPKHSKVWKSPEKHKKRFMCSIFHMMYAENSTSFLVLWGPQHLSRKHRSLTCFYLQCTKYDRISWEYCLPYLGSVFLLFRKITLQRQKTAYLLLNCMFFIDLLSLQQLAYQACVLTWIWHPRNCIDTAFWLDFLAEIWKLLCFGRQNMRRVSCQNGWADRCCLYSCVRLGCTLAPTAKYDEWSVHAAALCQI